jgi:uncharacterized membrane protein (UPF0127 family)
MGKRAFNVTRQQTVAADVRVADNYFTRLMGLMGKPGLPSEAGLWIVPCNDIHSFFMRFEFDAIFVDKQNTVVHLVERMKPWRISKFVKGGRAVLELPAGTIAASGTQLGDLIELQNG